MIFHAIFIVISLYIEPADDFSAIFDLGADS